MYRTDPKRLDPKARAIEAALPRFSGGRDDENYGRSESTGREWP